MTWLASFTGRDIGCQSVSRERDALRCRRREMERKLARLHSEQARSAGQVQALSAVTVAGLPRKLPAAPSSASSNGDGDSTANLQRMHSAAE